MIFEPYWPIIAVLAILAVLLWPIRAWIASRRNRTDDESGDTPLAPPPRRHRG